MANNKRMRVQDLGIRIGRYERGRHNAITDVRGVRVGHATVILGESGVDKASKLARTGVTAIIPNSNTFMNPVVGGAFVLNGAGELSGITQVMEWGTIETPILLTNTLSVGTCSDAVVKHYLKKYPEIGYKHDVVIPLVGECDDSWLNGITGQHVKDHHVFEAIESARVGPVKEGNVGAGAGMITCEFKGGIGTSSRKIKSDQGGFTIGVLVVSNFGTITDLRFDGVPVGQMLAPLFAQPKRQHSAGSIITIVATDAPLLFGQLNRLAKRAAIGIGRVGSIAAHGSGEIILAFSVSNTVRRDAKKMYYTMKMLRDNHMNPLYEAVIEGTEEAILNAVCTADEMRGVNGNFCPALPLERVKEIMQQYRPM